MKRIFMFLFLLGGFFFYSFSQVAINDNGNQPNPNAILDVDASADDKGILIPRLTSAQRIAMSLGSADEGLTVYDETTNNFWYWDGTQWVCMIRADEAWLTNGNDNVTSANFIGTKNQADLIFKTNSTEFVRITSDGFIGIGTTSPTAVMVIDTGRLWIVAPNGDFSQVSQKNDIFAVTANDHYAINGYCTGDNVGAAYFRNSSTSNVKPVVEAEQFGSGEGFLATSYGSGIPFRGQTNTAQKTAFFTNSSGGDYNYALHALYDGSGTTGNVAVYGQADNAGYGNGTGVKGKGGWTGIYGQGGVYAGYFSGDVKITGNLITSKSSVILSSKNQVLTNVISDKNSTVLSGNVWIGSDSIAVVKLDKPVDFKSVVYNLTPIGKNANLFVLKELNEDGIFIIKSSKPNLKVSWVLFLNKPIDFDLSKYNFENDEKQALIIEENNVFSEGK